MKAYLIMIATIIIAPYLILVSLLSGRTWIEAKTSVWKMVLELRDEF